MKLVLPSILAIASFTFANIEHDYNSMPPKIYSPPQRRIQLTLTSQMKPRDVFDELSAESEDLVESSSVVLRDGRRLIRYNHRYSGYDVWDSAVTLVVDNINFGGYIRSGRNSEHLRINLALKTPNKMLYWQSRIGKKPSNDADCRTLAGFRVTNVTSKKFIYELEDSVTLVDLFDIRSSDFDETGTPQQLYCLWDINNKKILKSWSGIQHFFGPGGGVKVGRYRYGVQRQRLPATRLPWEVEEDKFHWNHPPFWNRRRSDRWHSNWWREESSCKMLSPNGQVQIWDLRGNTSIIRPNSGGQPVEYQCRRGVRDEVNGGYGPSADCFFYAHKTVEMLKNSWWGGATRLEEISPVQSVIVGVHFGSEYDNAFWDGYGVHMGDGSQLFYSICSCHDILAHEIGHGVTAANSRLINIDDAGCLNEAFSDMTGETLKAYLGLHNDFKIGASCTKSKPYLRNLAEPMTLSQYKPPMQPHKCSGIFNHAFYLLAKRWNIRLAYRPFIFANRMYWTAESNMTTAACDVVTAAQELELGNPNDVVEVFKTVGIDVARCVASFAVPGSPEQVTELKNCQVVTGLKGSIGESFYFKIRSPRKSSHLWISILGRNGDADMYASIGQVPTKTNWKWRPFWEGSKEFVRDFVDASSQDYYIMIHAAEAFRNLALYSCFY